MPTLVDSNVILDMVNRDPVWLDWSLAAIEEHASRRLLANSIIYAELSCKAQSSPEVEAIDVFWHG